MKSIFSVSIFAFALFGLQASADWTCTYSCGSKGQEPKVGEGYTQQQACQDARSQICTQYVGGYPQYYQGSSYSDNGGGGGGGYGNEWQCTYSCGSNGQEPKVGYGYTETQAAEQAQSQICTQYVGGHPSFFQGCNLVSQ